MKDSSKKQMSVEFFNDFWKVRIGKADASHKFICHIQINLRILASLKCRCCKKISSLECVQQQYKHLQQEQISHLFSWKQLWKNFYWFWQKKSENVNQNSRWTGRSLPWSFLLKWSIFYFRNKKYQA